MTGTSRHKCQSSMVRCSLRGQHPRPVLYYFGRGAWAWRDALSRRASLVIATGTNDPDRAIRTFNSRRGAR